MPHHSFFLKIPIPLLFQAQNFWKSCLFNKVSFIDTVITYKHLDSLFDSHKAGSQCKIVDCLYDMNHSHSKCLTTYRISTTLSSVWRWDGARRGVCLFSPHIPFRDLQLRSMVQHGKVELLLLITVTYYV